MAGVSGVVDKVRVVDRLGRQKWIERLDVGLVKSRMQSVINSEIALARSLLDANIRPS